MRHSKLRALAFTVALFGIGCAATSEKQPSEGQTTPGTPAAGSLGEVREATMKLTGQRVEAACGQCQLGMAGQGCDLAIRHGGVAYYVDGVRIDDLGDAHAADGFCNTVRTAVADGQVVNGRFVATALELVDEP